MTGAGQERIPPAWLVGIALLPFGLVAGFTVTALPFLLTHRGVPLDRAAGVSAAVMSPTFWGFLLQPLMDTGLTRRAYAWLTAAVAAACLAVALPLIASARLGAVTVLLATAELAVVLFAGAVTGWIAEFTPDELRGRVSGWNNVANLGGGALGSLAVMTLAPRLGVGWVGVGLAAATILGAAPTLFFPDPRQSAFRFKQIFTDAMRTIWRLSKTPACLTGFALFLAPASAAAAINLFSGMGPDFHAPEHTVIWITGAGCAIATSIGALVGGYAADKIERGHLYLWGGIGVSTCALILAMTPHTPAAFIIGVLAYNGVAGVIYAAFNALGYQLVGQNTAVASTQLGLFAASTNFAIVYMTWADGRGYHFFGARGLLITDGLAGLITAVTLLLLLARPLRALRSAPILVSKA